MLRQIVAITAVNLKSIPVRWASSLVIIIGLAGVVAVFSALLAMSAGFESTLKATGSKDAALVLRGGSNAELNSVLTRDDATLIKLSQGIRKDSGGKPLASAELIVITELLRKGETKNGANVTLRGVEPDAFALRPQLHVVEGRVFKPGLRELLVGRGVTRQFEDAQLGKVLRMRGADWTIVGIFESGDAHDSELWTDAETAQSAYGRPAYSSVLAGMESPAAIPQLKTTLKADPRLNVDVQSEQDYFSSQTAQFRKSIGVLAGAVTFIMALGAIFAALNTMYAAVAARSREIATLRAIGFGGFAVLVSVMIESVALSLVGGVLGAAIAYLLFNGISVSTLGANFTQVVFAFKVTFGLVASGLVIAVTIGFFGGLLPAIRAARMQVTDALRAA